MNLSITFGQSTTCCRPYLGKRLRTRRQFLIGFFSLLACVALLPSCVTHSTGHATQLHPTKQLREDVFVRELTKGVWLHTTYFNLPKYGRYPANGLVVVDGKEAAMIDLPWTDDQASVLFDWIAKDLHATVATVVPTHWHADRAGGLGEAHRRGADSLALDKTAELLKKANRPIPHRTFSDKATVHVGRTPIELAYFGPGHTVDNIVAWLPSERILFGGCLVKALSATDLGNTEDADLKEYPHTLQRLRDAYPKAVTVIPGHLELSSLELIDHTIALCVKAP